MSAFSKLAVGFLSICSDVGKSSVSVELLAPLSFCVQRAVVAQWQRRIVARILLLFDPQTQHSEFLAGVNLCINSKDELIQKRLRMGKNGDSAVTVTLLQQTFHLQLFQDTALHKHSFWIILIRHSILAHKHRVLATPLSHRRRSE